MGGCASKPKAVKAETAEIPLPPENCTVCDSKASEGNAAVPVSDAKKPAEEVIVTPTKVQEITVEDGPESNRRQSLGNLFKESEDKELAAANRETEVVPKEVKEEVKREAAPATTPLPIVESKPEAEVKKEAPQPVVKPDVKAREASPPPVVEAAKPEVIIKKVEEAAPQVPTVAAKPEVIKVEEAAPQVPTVAAKPEVIKVEEAAPQVPTVAAAAAKPEVKTVVDGPPPPPSKPTTEVKQEVKAEVVVPEQEARPVAEAAVPAEVLKREVAVTSPAAPAAVKVEEKQKEVVAVSPSTTTTTSSSAEASPKLPSEVAAEAEKKVVDDSGKRPEGGDAVKTVVAVAK